MKTYEFSNGAIGHESGNPYDCVGPFAKVENCPVDGTDLRLTAYATGPADTFFSVPAYTRRKGKRIKGFFTVVDDGCVFVPYDKNREML